MLNKILLIGNVGREPERGMTTERVPFTKFSLAVSRTYKAAGQKRDETEWFQIVAWRQLAELIGRGVHKGAMVYVEGRVVHRKYTDKNGIERTRDEVIAEEVKFLKKGGQEPENEEFDDPLGNLAED